MSYSLPYDRVSVAQTLASLLQERQEIQAQVTKNGVAYNRALSNLFKKLEKKKQELIDELDKLEEEKKVRLAEIFNELDSTANVRLKELAIQIEMVRAANTKLA